MNYVRKINALKALFQENKTLDHKKWAINKERKMVDLKLECMSMTVLYPYQILKRISMKTIYTKRYIVTILC